MDQTTFLKYAMLAVAVSLPACAEGTVDLDATEQDILEAQGEGGQGGSSTDWSSSEGAGDSGGTTGGAPPDSSSGEAGATPSGEGGAEPAPPPPPSSCDSLASCDLCSECAVAKSCASAQAACDASEECGPYGDCMQLCAGDAVCAFGCEFLYPDGGALSDALKSCLCGQCSSTCGSDC